MDPLSSRATLGTAYTRCSLHLLLPNPPTFGWLQPSRQGAWQAGLPPRNNSYCSKLTESQLFAQHLY